MQTNYPSIKAIMQCGVDRGTAKQIKDVFTMPRDVLNELHHAARARTAECYNRPSLTDLRLTVIDSLLETYGVEGDDNLEWCNTGDTYATTVCFFRGRFVVSSWGDIVERHNL